MITIVPMVTIVGTTICDSQLEREVREVRERAGLFTVMGIDGYSRQSFHDGETRQSFHDGKSLQGESLHAQSIVLLVLKQTF